MIKFSLNTEKGCVLGVGLSDENLERLRAGHPILFDMAEVGMGPGQIIILHGASEAELVNNLAHLITPDTKVTIDPKLKS